MLARRSQIVHTNLAGHVLRVGAARNQNHGVQVMTMGQLAGRLAGGFLQPIDAEKLLEAVRAALESSGYGEIDAIRQLPGTSRAASSTLEKAWRADIDLSSAAHPRLQALHLLELETLRRLPPSMKRPAELVALARRRLHLAPEIIGPLEIHGHSEMSPCWRPLLAELTKVLPVSWFAGRRSVPSWLEELDVKIHREPPLKSETRLFSCATPHHEALEAFRWMRELIVCGKARPEEVAICAANPADFDDHALALAAEANIPIHFVHGVRAVTQRHGQTAAALAEALIKGVSQERVRRLFALLNGASTAIVGLPSDWARVLPADAPLTTVERWEQAFAQVGAKDWPEGVDQSDMVLGVLRLLERGASASVEAGQQLLPSRALALWRRALAEGPPEALPVTLSQLRIPDGLEPAAHVIWTSAISLASSPRPYVRLLALNAGRWPRRITEDRLIPDHIIPIEKLDPLPVAHGDRRDFETILASALSVDISLSRRDVEGRLLGRSPLIGKLPEIYLSRGRTPEHAASEPDRLLARASEFQKTPIAVSGLACWRDWFSPEITAHDGLVSRAHPRLAKIFKQPMSATSLKLLLRDPIRFAWRYGLGWKQPDLSDEPLTLDALTFGNLVHGVLEQAVNMLEAEGGFAPATPTKIEKAVGEATAAVAGVWEREAPVPPAIIWHHAQARAAQLAIAALTHPLGPLPGQKSWTEIPFGMEDAEGRNDLPWDPTRIVEIPGAGVCIQGHIDRLDLSGDRSSARVIDYKTGRVRAKMAEIALDGGCELQRCLYAYAVRTLLADHVKIEAALLYPSAIEDEKEALFPLKDVSGTLQRLTAAIAVAKDSIEAGLALPGTDAASPYNDLAFALPANASYLPRKMGLAEEKLGEATKIWEAA